MTTVAVHVDSKAELTTLLEQWEKEHGSGQDMVPILTRYEQLSFLKNYSFLNRFHLFTFREREKGGGRGRETLVCEGNDDWLPLEGP